MIHRVKGAQETHPCLPHAKKKGYKRKEWNPDYLFIMLLKKKKKDNLLHLLITRYHKQCGTYTSC